MLCYVMYVCKYVYMDVCMYARMHVSMQACMHVYICYIYACMRQLSYFIRSGTQWFRALPRV